MTATVVMKGELTDEQKADFKSVVQAFVDGLDEEVTEAQDLDFDVTFSE